MDQKPMHWKSPEAVALLDSLGLDWKPTGLPPSMVALAQHIADLQARIAALEAKPRSKVKS